MTVKIKNDKGRYQSRSAKASAPAGALAAEHRKPDSKRAQAIAKSLGPIRRAFIEF